MEPTTEPKKKRWKIFATISVFFFGAGRILLNRTSDIISFSLFGLGALSAIIFFFMLQGSDEAM